MTFFGVSTLSFQLFLSISFTIFSLRTISIHAKAWDEKRSPKSGVLSIETVYGDIYDCIDVYKQPSLKHPTLRNHVVKMKPQNISYNLRYKQNKNKSHLAFDYRTLWKSKKGCPKGTVPIRKMAGKDSRDHHLSHSLIQQSDGVDQFVGLYSKTGSKVFYGAGATLKIENPKLCSDQEDFSSASVVLQKGEPSLLEQIQAGWTVYPKLYGDNRTRLYTAWTKDNYQSTGCYNIDCSGFVLLSNKIPLDFALDYISVSGRPAIEVDIWIEWDHIDGWHFLTDDPASGEVIYIGYWPKSLFVTMQDTADGVLFGGQVYKPASENCSPQLGSGVFVENDVSKTCYMRNLWVIDQSRAQVDVDNSFVDATINSRCYTVGDYSFKENAGRYSFSFGGPGC